jgi:hypothetical protein
MSIVDDNGNLTSIFYIIHDLPTWENNGGTSDYRYLGGRAWLWDFNSTGLGGGGGNTVTQSADWWIDKADGAANQAVWPDTDYTSAGRTGIGGPPATSKNLGYLPINSDGDFLVSKMTTEFYLFAALSFWYVPDQFISVNDYDDMELSLPRRKFLPGAIMKGYDTVAGNFGPLAQIINSTDQQDSAVPLNDEMFNSSRRCLFQTPFPGAVYLEDTTSYTPLRFKNWNSVDNPFLYKIKRSNPRGGSVNSKVLPAFVATYTGNTSHGVKYTSTATANTWEWTSSGTAATNLVKFSDGTPNTGLTVDEDEDEIKIEIKTGSAASTLSMHTVSCFENRKVPN